MGAHAIETAVTSYRSSACVASIPAIKRQLQAVSVAVIATCLAVSTYAQSTDPAEPIEGIQAELTTARPLYDPAMPIMVRFSLRNVTDHSVEIPLDYSYSDGAGIGLPVEVAFGTDEQPALTLKYSDNPPSTLTRSSDTLTSNVSKAPTTIRLAPRSVVGGEFDLRDAAKTIRYPGLYHIEWKALGGRAGTATLDFRIEPRKQAAIVTDYGVITCTLLYDDAPRNVENFLELVRDGFYKNLTFHRIIAGFIAQGGCPKSDGTGIRPDGKLVPAELHDAQIDIGTLAMSHKRDAADTASCQFFLALARLPDLDGKYTVIGRATDPESLRTLNAIAAVPTDKNGKPIHGVLIRSINLLDILPESRKATIGK